MSIWAEPSAIPQISPPPPPPAPAPLPPSSAAPPKAAAPKSSNDHRHRSAKMAGYNFDAIESVPFDATNEQILLSSLSMTPSSASSTKTDDEYLSKSSPIATSSPAMESRRMSSLLLKLGSYFSHANHRGPMLPIGSVGQKRGATTALLDTTGTKLDVTGTKLDTAGMMATTKRHGSPHVNSSNNLNHKLNSSKCSHSDSSILSANSSNSAPSTEPMCSASDKRHIDQCVDLGLAAAAKPNSTKEASAAATQPKQLVAGDQLRNDSSETFTLPRVNLKQSATNTLSTTGTGNDDDAVSFEHPTEKRSRERSASQYSTEKSGSSGYYSSNIGSTRSSVDEHIYSEPLHEALAKANGRRGSASRKHGLDNLESSIKSLELHLKQLNRPTLPSACDGCYHDEKRRSSGSDRLPTIMEGIDIQVAASAEVTSINNHCWQNTVDDSLMDIDFDAFLLANEVRASRKKESTRVSTVARPTAGVDNPSFVQDEAEDADDERVAVGSTDSDKYRDNNYKCSKYVNSCPEDAYNVEGVINDSLLHGGTVDKSLALYLRKCENQIHYQNTRDILEDIREKLDALLESKATATRKDGQEAETASVDDSTTSSEKAMHENIQSLRNDLEGYLKMMNRQNEIEIKQFCSGLSKNYKLLTIQQAMENKARSRLSEYDFSQKCIYYPASNSDLGSKGSTDSGLDANRELSLYRDCEIIPQFDTVYVHDGLPFAYNHHNSTKYPYAVEPFHLRPPESMRSSSDSNFHLQRRRESMCSSCGEVAIIQCDGDSGDTEATPSTATTGASSPTESEVLEQEHQLAASHIASNLAMQQPSLITGYDDKELILMDWHRNKPSIWEQYYGSKRLSHAAVKKMKAGKHDVRLTMSYPSTRPESDFTLDLPRAEQLRIKMKKEKQFRNRCRIITSFLSFVFFLLTVMTVSLILTRGKRMFGSML